MSCVPHHGATTEKGTLFVREHHDFEWVSGKDPILMQDLGDLDGADGAHIPVVVASARYRIDVRAKHDRRELFVPAGTPPDDVASSVNPDLEPCFAHQSLHEGSSGNICIAKSDPINPAIFIATVSGKHLDPLLDAALVDTQVLFRVLGASGRGNQH